MRIDETGIVHPEARSEGIHSLDKYNDSFACGRAGYHLPPDGFGKGMRRGVVRGHHRGEETGLERELITRLQTQWIGTAPDRGRGNEK